MTTEIRSLKELYVDHLKDIYSAENQILNSLPKVIEKATSLDLKNALKSHLKETENQVVRIKKIFECLDARPGGKRCRGMEGVLEEGKEAMEEKMSSPELMDAALIAACQKVEHYEISAYGTARAFAELLGEDEDVDLLKQTLDEEKAADEKLTQIGMSVINVDALQGQGDRKKSGERM